MAASAPADAASAQYYLELRPLTDALGSQLRAAGADGTTTIE